MPYPDSILWNERFHIKEGKNLRCKIPVMCPDCGKRRIADRRNLDRLLKRKSYTGRCQHCHATKSGELHHRWRGGRHLGSDARYVYLTISKDDRFASMRNLRGEIAEHRLVIAQYIGRPLTANEDVHHIDGNRLNNSLLNLKLLSDGDHSRLHKQLESRKRVEV